MDAKKAGALIKEWRREKGWSQDDLAKAASLSKSQISNIESGIRRGDDYPLHVTGSTARKLADGFGMPYGVKILEMYGYPEQVEDYKRSQLQPVGAIAGWNRLDASQRDLIEQLVATLLSNRDMPDYHNVTPITALSPNPTTAKTLHHLAVSA